MGDEPERSPTFLRIVRGEPSVEEIAALVAVLSAGSGAHEAASPAPAFGWSARSSLMRSALPAGHGGWRASALRR